MLAEALNIDEARVSSFTDDPNFSDFLCQQAKCGKCTHTTHTHTHHTPNTHTHTHTHVYACLCLRCAYTTMCATHYVCCPTLPRPRGPDAAFLQQAEETIRGMIQAANKASTGLATVVEPRITFWGTSRHTYIHAQWRDMCMWSDPPNMFGTAPVTLPPSLPPSLLPPSFLASLHV